MFDFGKIIAQTPGICPDFFLGDKKLKKSLSTRREKRFILSNFSLWHKRLFIKLCLNSHPWSSFRQEPTNKRLSTKGKTLHLTKLFLLSRRFFLKFVKTISYVFLTKIIKNYVTGRKNVTFCRNCDSYRGSFWCAKVRLCTSRKTLHSEKFTIVVQEIFPEVV